jgi:hypothetical protein
MKGLATLCIATILVFVAGFCQAHVVINEVMFYSGAEGSDGDLQWIELYNPEPADVDIGGWILSNHPLQGDVKSRQLVFPAGTSIPSGGYVLLVNDLDDSKDHDGEYFTNRWSVPSGIQVLEYGREHPQLILDREGDDVHLSADGYRDVDAMWYGDGGEMGGSQAAPTVSAGSSLGRKPNGGDSDDPAVDFMVFSHPTPGATNQSAPVTERSTWSKIKLLFR